MKRAHPLPRVISEIDHLLTYVQDGKAAADRFRQLGFTLSPVSHIESMGITNQMVLFRDTVPGSANFIELMSVADANKLPPAMVTLLSGQTRIKSMVLSTPDAQLCHQHLTKLGIPFAPPLHIRREWELGNGTSVFPEFDVLLPQEDGLTFNACSYGDVSLYTRPDWTTHANTVTGLDAVFCMTKDPLKLAERFSSIMDAPNLPEGPAFRVAPGRTALEIWPTAAIKNRFSVTAPEAGDPTFLGYRLRANNLEVFSKFARSAYVDFIPSECGLLLSSDAMFGNVVEVVEADR